MSTSLELIAFGVDPRSSLRAKRSMCGRPLACKVWGRIFRACVRLRACVRPVDAAEAAGQDGFRGREIQTIQRPRSAVASRGLSPVADRTIPSIFLSLARSAKASPNVVSSPPISSGGCDSSAASLRVALATHHQFPGDPRHFIGQRHRRELGGLALQERQHPAGWVLRSAPAVCRITAVAPTTRQLRSIGSPARVMRPGRALPAVEWSRGVSPSQAAKSHPA